MERATVIIFISGGARSGKSCYAEQRALSLAESMQAVCSKHKVNLYYVATAKRSDTEMDKRIQEHQQQRGSRWRTIEEPYHIESVPDHIECLQPSEHKNVILVDCLTLWVSHLVFDLQLPARQIIAKMNHLLQSAQRKGCHLVLVSNDVNEGLPSPSESVRYYIYILERLHQHIAHQADEVIQVVAGLPMMWKQREKGEQE